MKVLRAFFSWRRCGGGLLLPGLLLAISGFGQSAIDEFDPDVNDRVSAVALQSDGKIIVGGEFTAVGGIGRTNLARLNVDGSVDVGFTPGTDIFCEGCYRSVFALAVQADGKILVGGVFTTLNGESRTNLGRLNSDGTLDPGFHASAGGPVLRLSVLADGKILVAGGFYDLNGQPRTGIGRLNSDGSLEADFDAGADDTINNMVVQPDGKILVGGDFSQLGGQVRIGVGRLNADGTLDASFNPPAISEEMDALALQSDGKVLVGGDFTEIGDVPRAGIGRLNADGSLETAFNPGAAGDGLHTLVVQPDGKILVGGFFTELGGQARMNIGRLNPDGSLDAAFRSEVNSAVNTFVIQPDGKILVGGWFTTLGGANRNHLARLHRDGTLDATLNPGATNPGIIAWVRTAVPQGDGKILVGGDFTVLAGQQRERIGRLGIDGSLEIGLNPGANQYITAILVQPDGKIVVGGDFGLLGGELRPGIGRLNADGSLDQTFVPITGGTARCLGWQSDGKILVGGNIVGPRGGVVAMARFNADGTLDRGFDPGFRTTFVNTVIVQPDGMILITGAFSTGNEETFRNLARLKPDGSLDPGFNPQLWNTNGLNRPEINATVLLPDGKILVAGVFDSLGGQLRRGLGRLNPDGTLDTSFDPQIATGVVSMVPQADGKVLVGGLFTQMGGQPRERIARFNADGTLDLTFNPGANAIVNSLFVQSDGGILIGGDMTIVGGQPRLRIARLSTDRPATQSLMLDPMGRTITWLRGGASPEVDQVFFALSTNGSDFTILGSASRVSGGWRLTGVALPSGENFYIRAQGLSRGGRRNGSSGLIESVAQFWRLPSPLLSSVQILGGGVFQFSFTNTTTTNFTVLASTNASLPLSNWTSLGPPTAVGNGLYQFSDPTVTNHARRFYQLRSP